MRMHVCDLIMSVCARACAFVCVHMCSELKYYAREGCAPIYSALGYSCTQFRQTHCRVQGLFNILCYGTMCHGSKQNSHMTDIAVCVPLYSLHQENTSS